MSWLRKEADGGMPHGPAKSTKCVKCGATGETGDMVGNEHGAGYLCKGCAPEWNKEADGPGRDSGEYRRAAERLRALHSEVTGKDAELAEALFLAVGLCNQEANRLEGAGGGGMESEGQTEEHLGKDRKDLEYIGQEAEDIEDATERMLERDEAED